jgi:hypothetical protein
MGGVVQLFFKMNVYKFYFLGCTNPPALVVGWWLVFG